MSWFSDKDNCSMLPLEEEEEEEGEATSSLSMVAAAKEFRMDAALGP